MLEWLASQPENKRITKTTTAGTSRPKNYQVHYRVKDYGKEWWRFTYCISLSRLSTGSLLYTDLIEVIAKYDTRENNSVSKSMW